MLESDREDAGCPVGQRPASGTHLSRLRGLACFPGFRLLLSTRRRAVHIPDLTSPSFRHNRLHLRPLVPARSCPVHFGKGCPRCSMLRLPRSRSPRSHSAATCDPCCITHSSSSSARAAWTASAMWTQANPYEQPILPTNDLERIAFGQIEARTKVRSFLTNVSNRSSRASAPQALHPMEVACRARTSLRRRCTTAT